MQTYQLLQLSKQKVTEHIFHVDLPLIMLIIQYDDCDTLDSPEDMGSYGITNLMELKVNHHETCKHFVGIIKLEEEFNFKIKFLT